MMRENKENDARYDLIVIGGGPAGLTAAIYAVRSGLNTLLIEKGICGGFLNEIPRIENYPGFKQISGMELASRLKEHAADYVEIREIEEVLRLSQHRGSNQKSSDSFSSSADFIVQTTKQSYVAKALIICTGTRHRKLGVVGEDEFLGKGVSYCATCDGFFFKNKRVIVVGGGDSAATQALFLKNIGCDVTIVHRRDSLRAGKYLQRMIDRAEIPILWNSVVKEIKGSDRVECVVITERGNEREIPVDGVFVAIGEVPNSELASHLNIECDDSGYIVTDRNQRTNVERVYAAGDVSGGVRQVIVACAEGAVAAMSAYEDITSEP